MSESFIIIYLDLVGYSKNNEPIQVSLFRNFQKEIHHILYDEILDETCILIPTGDGMIIGIKNIQIDVTFYRSFELVCGVIDWTKRNKCNVRSAIHIGNVNILKDINRMRNIIGNTINDAARILSGSNDGGIIISKDFYKTFLQGYGGRIDEKTRLNDNWQFEISDEDVVIDKHSFEHNVYNILLYLNDNMYGTNEKILNKYFTNIYSTEYPKSENLKKNFSKKIENAVELDFIGLYHPSLPIILDYINLTKSRTISINIFFACDTLEKEIEQFFNTKEGNLNLANKKPSLDSILNWKEKARKENVINLSIYEYTNFIPFGASLVDKSLPGNGFIHISNYLPSIIPAQTSYIEVEWKTKNMPPIYNYYYSYLNSFIHGEQQAIKKIN